MPQLRSFAFLLALGLLANIPATIASNGSEMMRGMRPSDPSFVARAGFMSAEEVKIFENFRINSEIGNVAAVNAIFALQKDEVTIRCLSDGQSFRGPMRPLIKYAIKNNTTRKLNVPELSLENLGWSDKPVAGIWNLEYSVFSALNMSMVHIIPAGGELNSQALINPMGDGAQQISLKVLAPVWTRVSAQGSDISYKEVTGEAKCKIDWQAKPVT